MFVNPEITADACAAADCLHPCYGASHERGCNTCLMFAISKLKNGEDVVLSDEQYAICDQCKIPPVEIDMHTLMTFDEFMAYVQS